MKLLNNWEKTGILAVDMVASAASYLRLRLKPVKTIYLNPKLYYQFEYWVSRHMDEEQFHDARENGFQFDGIDIKKQSNLLVNDISWDFYEDKPDGSKE
jgi:hypothetical protein